MAPPEGIQYPADLEELLRALVMQAIEDEDRVEARVLRGARVLYPGGSLDPSFVIKLADGRQFEVIVRDID